ncbi:MAG: hypothetical protein E5X48_31015 [Mesorhizobium sp.]|uniref:hypothetical protein n=1 Tax=Mesorhizobium sp. TaxID=1871066 RepID=UPI00121ED325|nr:hypothetical protein [Mesorhizobium sp.]TIQ28741.1 MAG: hypothetical protein E5X48_31015 [Mesorhizobium sp.]
MAMQHQIDATIGNFSKRTERSKSKILDDTKGWRVSDVTLGYMVEEAKVDSAVTFAFGLTNLTEIDLNLDFPTTQRILVKIFDPAGKKLYETPDGSAVPTRQVIKAATGSFWTEKVTLVAGTFASGTTYQVTASLSCDFFCMASVVMPLP